MTLEKRKIARTHSRLDSIIFVLDYRRVLAERIVHRASADAFLLDQSNIIVRRLILILHSMPLSMIA